MSLTAQCNTLARLNTCMIHAHHFPLRTRILVSLDAAHDSRIHNLLPLLGKVHSGAENGVAVCLFIWLCMLTICCVEPSVHPSGPVSVCLFGQFARGGVPYYEKQEFDEQLALSDALSMPPSCNAQFFPEKRAWRFWKYFSLFFFFLMLWSAKASSRVQWDSLCDVKGRSS